MTKKEHICVENLEYTSRCYHEFGITEDYECEICGKGFTEVYFWVRTEEAETGQAVREASRR